MTDRTPKPLEQYRHFKGGRYQILCIAEKEDTGEPLVVYQALYEEAKIYARALSDFTSPVDPVKYPSSAQYWRFERILPPEEAAEPKTEAPAEEARGEASAVQPDASAETAGIGAQDAGGPAGLMDSRRRVSGAGEPDGGAKSTVPVGILGSREPETVEPKETPGPPEAEEETIALDPAVEQFLDAERAEEKLGALTMARGRITDDMIDIMSASMGIEIEPGPIQERYEDLKGCLLTISRYELDRTRFRH